MREAITGVGMATLNGWTDVENIYTTKLRAMFEHETSQSANSSSLLLI